MDKQPTRRRFLRVSLLSSALISTGLLLERCFRGGASVGGLACFSAKEYRVLHAVARRMLHGASPKVVASLLTPGEVGVDVARWADGYVARLHEVLREDLRGLLQLLEHSTWLLGRGGRFTALADEAQDAVLRDWQQSRLALRRQGFQALKSLCCLAYYQDERSFAGIGYSGPQVPARSE